MSFALPISNGSRHAKGFLAHQAALLRLAIEECQLERHLQVMATFPSGCCRPTSQLLAKYLVTEAKIPMVSFVSGQRTHSGGGKGWESHVWVTAGGHIVDITADQYPEVSETVLVTDDPSWHDTFTTQRQLPYGEMMTFPGRPESRAFERMYKTIARHLRRNGHIRRSRGLF